jgi:hypothetical protein
VIFGHQQRDEQRHGENTDQSQRIGKIHPVILVHPTPDRG